MSKKMEQIVLSYPKLKERIGKKSEDRAKALKNLDEIRADFSKATIETFEKMLDASLPKLYDGINLNNGGHDIPKLAQENCVILVPNHQSHADYVAINYMFYKNYDFPLYVAGGNNLNIFPIGTLFRKSGCFFIRRTFANDILYKLTLEAYLYYLLHERRTIEFFFEGGRSRTGKLLSPRFGLYQMLLEAHSQLPEERKVPLVFLPTSIVHEYVPEQKSLTSEAKGAKKKKESSMGLLGLLKLFAYQFGSIHITFGKAIPAKDISTLENESDTKHYTQELAFSCFREVGRHMKLTPTSLLALTLLDEPSGALQWKGLLEKAEKVLRYCKKFNVPFVDSLKDDKYEESLARALDIMIGNRKVDVLGKSSRGVVLYSIKEEARGEILYFKNTILHHFLVPWFINSAWIHVFNGRIKTSDELKAFLLKERQKMKHEFYLPTTKQLFVQAAKIISEAIGREAHSFDEFMKLTHQEMYAIASSVGVFSRACNYIDEAYYSSALSLKMLAESHPEGFKMEQYLKKFKEVFDEEKKQGIVVKYPESYSEPVAKTSLKFFIGEKLIDQEVGVHKINNTETFEKVIQDYETSLAEQLNFKITV